MKIKKIKPTPKSITHKKPIKISPSSSKSQTPNIIKQNPPRSQRVKILYGLIKKAKVKNASNCKIEISLNIS